VLLHESGASEPGDESKHDDARGPNQAEDYCYSIEVALSNSRRAEVGRYPTTEHVGKPATATAVKKY
jgi:hypothetical protein